MRNIARRREPGKPVSPHVGARYIYEIGVGSGSAVRYHLLSDPCAIVIGIDIMDHATVIGYVSRELPHERVDDCMRRFKFCRIDMVKLKTTTVDAQCRQHFGVPATYLHHIHFSWPCTTTSKADRGLSEHRWPDGSPRSDRAKNDDRCLAVVLSVIQALRRVNPDILVTIEQPENDVFLGLPAVRILLQDKTWHVMRGNHCSAASSAMDMAWQVNNNFPWKLSIYVVTGLDEARLPVLRLCQLDCAHRLVEAPQYHRNVVCRRRGMVPGQRVITDVMEKGRIPYFIFHQFWMSNCSRRGLKAHESLAFVCARLVSRGETKTRVAELLHCRLGHPGEKVMRGTLRELGAHEHGVVPFSSNCRACDAGKLSRRPHNKHLPRARYFNERVHADLVAFEVCDIHGHQYALVMVEDLTRAKYVYPLKLKSDAGAALQTHCRQEGVMHILRADGGGEFGGRDAAVQVYLFGIPSVLAVCSMYGIRREETVPDVHDQNGVAELAIRRGVEATRTLLYAANLPKELWSYALRHWAAVDRLTVNTALGASPYKLRYGIPPVKEVQALRTFGSRITFRGKHKDDHKLDMLGHRGVYLGQNSVNGGHEILDVEAIDPKVVTTVDIQPSSIEEIMEPAGVNDQDLKLTSSDLPSKPGLSYPPVRAIQETVRLPGAQGQGTMWELFHEFRDKRILELRKTKPESSWNELQKIVSMEWQAGANRARADAARRLEAWSNAQSSEPPPMPDGATTSTRADDHNSAEKSGGNDESAEKSGGNTEKNSGGPEATDFMDTLCQQCGQAESSTADPMLLCDACDHGWHLGCLGPNGEGVDEMPSKPGQTWFCESCRPAGLRVQIRMRRTGRTRRSDSVRKATILDCRRGGTCTIRFDGDEAAQNNFVLDAHEWHPLAALGGQYQLYVNALTATDDQVLPTDYIADAPKGMKAALHPSNPLCKGWAEAMRTHMATLFAKGVFTLLKPSELPANPEVLPVCWIYVIKPDKLKARLVILGNRSRTRIVRPGAIRQSDGVGHDDEPESVERDRRKTIELETSSPTPRMAVWKLLFTLGIKMGYTILHVDIVSAFTHTVPQRQVFIKVPEYLRSDNFSGYMLVRRNGFGLNESPYSLYIVVQNWMLDFGLEQSAFDPCVYVRSAAKRNEWPPVFVVAQVDDFAWIGPNDWCEAAIDKFGETFDIERLGRVSRWQGIEVHWLDEGLFLTQTRQIQLTVKRAGVLPGRNVQMPAYGERMSRSWCPQTEQDKLYMRDKPYRAIVGSVGYIVQGTRLDCAFSHKEAARYNANPGPRHWARLMEMVQFLRKTPHHGILLPRAGGFQLSSSCDADYNGDPDERMSSSGIVVDFGGAPIAAISRTQKWTSKSVGQSEHGALAQCAAELLFYRHVLQSLELNQGVTGVHVNENTSVDMRSDSNVAMAAAGRAANWMTDKFKHVESHMKFFHQYVAAGVLKLVKVPSAANSSDVLTKQFASVEKFRAAASHYVRELPEQLRKVM